MLLLAPDLFVAALLHHPSFAVDRRADTAQRAGIDIQEKTGETRPRRFWWGRTFAREVGRSASRWPVGYPVVHEDGDVRVFDQVDGFLGGGVGGHDDAGRGGKWGGWEEGVVHQGDVGI